LSASVGGAPTTGRALCLSGGGYRAMLFHLGVLWRLNELGWLPTLDRVSSVSAGSITSAVLGRAWERLDFGPGGVAARFGEAVVTPIRAMAATPVDVRAVVRGLLQPGTSVGDRVVAAYDSRLFGGVSLQDLPDRPRFVLNATNVSSGALVRFSKPYLADWRVGRILRPTTPLAVAVACSSAFPPFLSPYRLDLLGQTWQTDVGNDLTDAAHRDALLLSDGGVYDNLGIETAWKSHRTVLVSDAGASLAPQTAAARDWPRHLVRTLKVVDAQVRTLRKRQVVGALETGERAGAYFGIRSDISDYPVADRLPVPHPRALELAGLPTRLASLPRGTQDGLINWGYAVCDAGMRAYVTRDAPPGTFPYPRAV
jgi:NTE family protein